MITCFLCKKNNKNRNCLKIYILILNYDILYYFHNDDSCLHYGRRIQNEFRNVVVNSGAICKTNGGIFEIEFCIYYVICCKCLFLDIFLKILYIQLYNMRYIIVDFVPC